MLRSQPQEDNNISILQPENNRLKKVQSTVYRISPQRTKYCDIFINYLSTVSLEGYTI